MGTKSTDVTKATIWEDGDVVEMARFLVDGANGLQADVATITRKIYNVSTGNTLIATDVLDKTTTVFDTLQTTTLDPSWTKDKTGYNFKDRIAGSNFATGGDTYRVEYSLIGDAAEAFWIVYEHDANAVLSS